MTKKDGVEWILNALRMADTASRYELPNVLVNEIKQSVALARDQARGVLPPEEADAVLQAVKSYLWQVEIAAPLNSGGWQKTLSEIAAAIQKVTDFSQTL